MKLEIDYVVGVSAGARNAVSYISGQPERNYSIFKDFSGDERYMGKMNMLKTGSYFGFDFMFKELTYKLLPLDIKAFENSKIQFSVGTTDCETGKPVWFTKEHVKGDFDVLRASSSLPLISTIVEYGGHKLLDGGIASPIPIDKSIEDGNDRNIIVLTRNAGFRCGSKYKKVAVEAAFHEYPNFVRALLDRHYTYNRQLDLCEQQEKKKKAVIIRPGEPLEVDAYERNSRKLVNLYHEGFYDTYMLEKDIKKLTEQAEK